MLLNDLFKKQPSCKKKHCGLMQNRQGEKVLKSNVFFIAKNGCDDKLMAIFNNIMKTQVK